MRDDELQAALAKEAESMGVGFYGFYLRRNGQIADRTGYIPERAPVDKWAVGVFRGESLFHGSFPAAGPVSVTAGVSRFLAWAMRQQYLPLPTSAPLDLIGRPNPDFSIAALDARLPYTL